MPADTEATPRPEADMTERARATGAANVRGLAVATATALRLTASAARTAGTPVSTVVGTPLPATEIAPPQAETSVSTRPATAPPAATQAPPTLPPADSTPGPVTITTFTVDRASIQPGESVNLSWASSGGATARLYQSARNTDMGREWIDLPPNGSLAVQVDGRVRETYYFSLFVYSHADIYQGTAEMRTLFVRLPCPDTYFFAIPASWQPSPTFGPAEDEACPASPAVSASMAEQAFERGRMIWIQPLDMIYVLYDTAFYSSNRLLEVFQDSWTTGEPDSDPGLAPPPGLYQPVRGFGKVWRENAQVRERLGWARAPEQAFGSLYQQPWSTYYQRPGESVYLRDAAGRTLRLFRAYYGRFSSRAWEEVGP
jgi:hypothetical protein